MNILEVILKIFITELSSNASQKLFSINYNNPLCFSY
jgi:hypothetical protein